MRSAPTRTTAPQSIQSALPFTYPPSSSQIPNMASSQIILALACLIVLVIGTEVNTSTLEERLEAMEANIARLQDDVEKKDSEISGLRSEIKGLKIELHSMDSPTVFDCYLSERWVTDGIIQFNGCDGKQEIR